MKGNIQNMPFDKASSQSLPLGLVGSGLLLTVFTGMKGSISILLMAARNGHQDGFPFLFETVLVFPFTMQILFYTAQTCWQMKSTYKGLAAILEASVSMGPCCFYAGFVTSTTVLETYSLQFILPSMFVVLKQLTMVVIAAGEVVMLAARPSRMSWSLIVAQAICVGLFQYSATPKKAPRQSLEAPLSEGMDSAHAAELDRKESASLTIGVVACLLSVATGGMGSILQQRFMQRQAKALPISVKLFWQHAIELVFVIMFMLVRSQGRARLRADGFFGGWNGWAYVVSVFMWFSFLSASAISAYVSALAGAMGVAVSVALTGVLELLIFGRDFSRTQFVLMGCVCLNAVLYTRERMATLSNVPVEETREKGSAPKGHDGDMKKTESPEDIALLSLCEDSDTQQAATQIGATQQTSREAVAVPANAAATPSLRPGFAADPDG